MTRSQYTPVQWHCFEGLCSVLYDIGDYSTCCRYIQRTLGNYSDWELGHKLLKDMKKEDDMEWIDSVDIDEQQVPVKPIVITIQKADANLLIDKLLTLYKKQHTTNNAEEELDEEALETNIGVDNTLFIHNAIKIVVEDVQLPETPVVTEQITPEITEAQKRKREDTDAVTGEEEESDQDEAKKANLRASRRKKDKFLNTEASRIKMIEEEIAFDVKIQKFYNTLKNIPNLHKEQHWCQPQHESLTVHPHFWDWFDIKISELENTYSWDMDRQRGDLNSINSKSLSMFSVNYACNTKSDSNANQLIKNIISELNTANSGVMDVLCQLVTAIIKQDMVLDAEDTSVMSGHSLDLLTETIFALESNFTHYLSFMNNFERALATLRVCEYFLDRLIRAIMVITQESGPHSSFSASYKKKPFNLLSKQNKAKQIESLAETTRYWSDLAEKTLLDLSLNWFNIHVSQERHEGIPVLSEDEQILELRFWAIQGKLAQCQDNSQNASTCYQKCQDILMANPLLKKVNVKSMYDSCIDMRTIENKLSLLEGGNLLVQAKNKSDSGDFFAVIDVIKPMIDSKLDASEPIGSDETIQLIVLLAKAYVQSKQHIKAWDCYKQIFCSSVKQMVDYGNEQFQSKSIFCKDDDIIFFEMGRLLGDALDALLTLIQDTPSEEWLLNEVDKEFMDVLRIVLKMSLHYVFRHPDFVPLVNNFSSPDSIPHTPSKITKSNRFNAIAVKSWVMYSLLMKRELSVQNQDTKKIMLDWTKLLQELHDELGEREICCSSDDVFLYHLLENFFETDRKLFRKDIYQCYHCIYGVHLGTDTDLIEEHYCTHRKLDQKAAEKLFGLVSNAAIKKLTSGSLLKADLKDVIDTVSEHFEQLPSSEKQTAISSNKKVIENYLDGDLDLSSRFTGSIYRKTLIPTVPIDAKKNNISAVFFKIFWIRGKTHRLQIRNRTKISTDKNMSDLESAIEEFTSHLIINPNDGPGWYELGACYHQLADEELNWSATNITSHKKQIAEYQKKACHSILRAIYLKGLPREGSQRGEIFTQFGNLLYSMATPPMDMLAFEPEITNSFIGRDGNLTIAKRGIHEEGSVYKRCMAMYVHALRYQNPAESMWRCYYGTGKCSAKMGRPPTEVLGWYIKAIQESKKEHPRDLLIEPVYIFCAAIVKYLYRGKITATVAIEFLCKERQVSQLSTEINGSYVFDHDLLQNGRERLPPDVLKAYQLVFKRLLDLVNSDTKGWQHRPVYRLAWMHYYIFRNSEEAKSRLLKLFSFKANIKNHINIWKPGFEFPGKHYVYIQKYTSFMIQLAKETKDDNLLEQLGRKLRKGQTILLNHETLMNEVTVSENTQ
ncbi:unnamed protein product [Rhizopus stolonifer]